MVKPPWMMTPTFHKCFLGEAGEFGGEPLLPLDETLEGLEVKEKLNDLRPLGKQI